uniref:G_PROTEIN_RECEP_F1_2 domain-containing protein n=1 Tax=Elaeophora elaphi TaxID=1147741 RepID=A0A0R3RJP8_9BILA
MLALSYHIIVLFLILPLSCQEKNKTYKADIRDENHKVTKYVAVTFFTILLIYGITSNTVMAIILCQKKNNQYSREFILIVSQLIISNFMNYIPQVTVVLPEIIQTTNSSYANKAIWINQISSTFYPFAIFAVLHFSFLLTLNRFVALTLPQYSSFFNSGKLYFLIVFVWFSVS